MSRGSNQVKGGNEQTQIFPNIVALRPSEVKNVLAGFPGDVPIGCILLEIHKQCLRARVSVLRFH